MILAENGLDDAGSSELILRRVQSPTAAPAPSSTTSLGVQLLREVGRALVEIHGQHDDRALVDPDAPRPGRCLWRLRRTSWRWWQLWEAWRAAETRWTSIAPAWSAPRRDADYLRHASMSSCARSAAGEETALAGRRTMMMQAEKIAGDLREAHDAVGGTHSPVPALAAAVRRLERRAGKAPALVEPAVKAIDVAIDALERPSSI